METALLKFEGREVNERDRAETEAMLALGQRKDRYDYQRYTEDKYKRPAHEKPKTLNHYLSLGLVVTWYALAVNATRHRPRTCYAARVTRVGDKVSKVGEH